MTQEGLPLQRQKIVILLSGTGTNFQSILNAVRTGDIDAEIALVVSNRKAAFGLTRAEQAGVPTCYFPLKPYRDTGKSREEYDEDLAMLVLQKNPALIVLAGWMHVFSPAFLNWFPGKVINLHPALPGSFPGTDAVDRAYEAYKRSEIMHSGCMVHYVVPDVDAGPVIAQCIVPFSVSDTLESYEERIHEAEHQLIVEAIRKVLETT